MMKKTILTILATVLLTIGIRAQTLSSFPWQQDFKNTTVLDSNWIVSNGWPASQRSSNGWSTYQGGAYIITPPIAVPVMSADYLAFWVGASSEGMDVLVDTAAGTNIVAFTDTLLSYRWRWGDDRQVHAGNLSSFAGQTIRLAVKCRNDHGFYLNWIRIDQDTLPIIEVTKPSVIITDREARFDIELVHGAADGIIYTWSSQLMGTSGVTTVPHFSITYNIGGTDTMTIVATNGFGSDTVVTMVNVIPCPDITAFPWTETFDNGIYCWLPLAGSNWQWTITNVVYSPLGSRMMSESSSGIDSWIVSRPIHIPAATDDSLGLSWEAFSTIAPSSYHHNYYVLATTGDYGDRNAYDTLYQASPDYVWSENHFKGSVPLVQYAGQTIHIAFCNHPPMNPIWNAKLLIDNVRVYSIRPPVLSMPARQHAFAGDTTTFAALLQQGSASNLTYTWHSLMLDTTAIVHFPSSTFRLVYPASGVDTLTLVATNSYGSDTAVMIVTVNSCSVLSVPWQETFSTAGSIECWYGDWSWTSFDGGCIQSVSGLFCSPAIDIPADAVGLWMRWKKILTASYNVLVSPTGGFLAADFTDTLYSGNGQGDSLISIEAYAGHRIRIAFEKSMSANIRIDEVQIAYDTTPPSATLSVSRLQVRTSGTVTVTATLNACSPRSYVNSWHSSLLDSTVTSSSPLPTFCLRYATRGIDTITYIVSNQYGADTHQVVVEVIVCGIQSIPFSEDFNSVGESVPACWDVEWSGMDINAPRVLSVGTYYRSPDGTPSLQLRAGIDTAWNNTVIVKLPRMTDPLNHLLLSFWYAYEHASHGTFSVGYMVGDNYVRITELQRQTNGRIISINLHNLPDDAERLAFRFVCADSPWWSVNLDNIKLVPIIPVDTSRCDSKPLPYVVNFNPNTGTVADGGNFPVCWERLWNGDAYYAPTVETYLVHDTTPLLDMWAGTAYSSLDTVAYVVLPGFADTLRNLSLSFWYVYGTTLYENWNRGILSVGYFEDSVFVPISDMTPVLYNASAGENGRRDTIRFDSVPLTASRMALRWSHHDSSSMSFVLIDDLSVWYTDCPECHSDPVWHTVAVTANVDGICTPYGAGLYMEGDTALIGYHVSDTVTIGGHWQFLSWNDGEMDNPRSVIVVSDTAFALLFQWVVDSTDGIGENQNLEIRVDVYPNPTQGKVTVISRERLFAAYLTDMMGHRKEVCLVPEADGRYSLDLNSCSQSTYLLTLTTIDGRQLTVKLLKVFSGM